MSQPAENNDNRDPRLLARIAELEGALDFPYHEADGQIVIAEDDLILMFRTMKRPVPDILLTTEGKGE